MHKTTIFIIELCFVDKLFHFKSAKTSLPYKVIANPWHQSGSSMKVLQWQEHTLLSKLVKFAAVWCQRIMQWKVQCFIISMVQKYVLAGLLKVDRSCSKFVGVATAKDIAEWIFSTVGIFLTIKEYFLELWYHILSYSMQEVPNFMTINLLDSIT